MSDTHDAELGRHLRSIPVFEHRGRYWDDLEAALAAEHSRIARRRRRLMWRVAAVAAAACLVAVIGLAGLPGSHGLERLGDALFGPGAPRLSGIGPETAKAYDRVRRALGRTQAVGEVALTLDRYDAGGTRTETVTLQMGADGSWRRERRNWWHGGRLEPFHVLTYDFPSNTVRQWDWGPSRAGARAWREALPPCVMIQRSGVLAQDTLPTELLWYRTVARNALEMGACTVRQGTLFGRPTLVVAQRIDGPLPFYVNGAWTDFATADWRLVIDEATGILLEWTVVVPDGRVVARVQVTRLDLTPGFASGRPQTGFPHSVHFAPSGRVAKWMGTPSRPTMTAWGEGVRRVALDVLRARKHAPASYLPGWVPNGLRLWEAVVARDHTPGFEVAYRAGLDYLLVSAYAGRSQPTDYTSEAQPLLLTGGAFAGLTAWIEKPSSPSPCEAEIKVSETEYLHLKGSLSRNEMVRVMNSFQAPPR